ncbi:MAG TPA: TadE/TadG family type IV pilus assembly protein [Pseudolabrys sp.]|nr:TadE/TadG family type IV pilus assembly protein [Pseudolabrys sp.]
MSIDFRRLSTERIAAMFEIVRNTLTAGARRLFAVSAARRFGRRQDGAAAVEFALIAVPFMALLFAILEAAMVFFAGQTLEAATADSARLILTGQAQTDTSPTTGSVGYSQADFKNAVCARVASMFDCTNKIYISVKSYSTFAQVDTSSPVTNGVFDTTKMQYSPGSAGDIVIVQVFYQWPIYVSLLDGNLSNLTGNSRLLVATSVFRNEPFLAGS